MRLGVTGRIGQSFARRFVAGLKGMFILEIK